MKKFKAVIRGSFFCFMMMAAGAAWADDGTVNTFGSVWLKNANCFGKQNWDDAVSRVASLKSGDCGLRDGSQAGRWRLPTLDELKTRQVYQNGFTNVQQAGYWTSTAYSTSLGFQYPQKYMVFMYNGNSHSVPTIATYYVWPVRNN